MKIMLIAIIAFLNSCASKTEFESKTINGISHSGKIVSIDLKLKKATVLIFLSSTCPCSDSHVSIVKSLSKKFTDFQFVGVHSNYNEDKGKAAEYFKEKDFSFPIIYDAETVIAKKFGALKTPHVFILNNQSEIIYNGSVTDSANAQTAKEQFLEKALVEISNGLTPSTPRKKTLGCYIALKE